LITSFARVRSVVPRPLPALAIILTLPEARRSLSLFFAIPPHRSGAWAQEVRRKMMSTSAHYGVAVIKPGQTYVGKQRFTYSAGAWAETVGAKEVCMNVLPMPPGAVAKAHYHKAIETIAYMLEGECAVYWGDNLQHRVILHQGEQCFVAADMPHAPCNES